MQARGWKTDDVAIRMGSTSPEEIGRDLLALNMLMCVQRDNLTIGEDMLRKLATAFGVSADLFRGLDRVWRESPNCREPFEAPDDIFGPASRRAMMRVV